MIRQDDFAPPKGEAVTGHPVCQRHHRKQAAGRIFMQHRGLMPAGEQALHLATLRIDAHP